MRAVAVECIEWLKEEELYDSFFIIAKAGSTKFVKENWWEIHEMSIEEAVTAIKEKDVLNCEEKIINKIDRLIYYGFIQFVGFEYGKIQNMEYQSNCGIMDENYDKALYEYKKNHPIDKQTKIKLSEDACISGKYLIEEIDRDESDKAMTEKLANAISPIEEAYRDYVDKSRNELEKKINAIENGTIKSIEIISIFTAVISLFLSNIIGILNYGTFSLKVILIMNMSIVLCIFFLLILTRLLVREKDEKKSFVKAIILITIFIVISLILIA